MCKTFPEVVHSSDQNVVRHPMASDWSAPTPSPCSQHNRPQAKLAILTNQKGAQSVFGPRTNQGWVSISQRTLSQPLGIGSAHELARIGDSLASGEEKRG